MGILSTGDELVNPEFVGKLCWNHSRLEPCYARRCCKGECARIVDLGIARDILKEDGGKGETSLSSLVAAALPKSIFSSQLEASDGNERFHEDRR